MTFPISQIRIARPTNQLDALTRFYKDGLLFNEIGSFTNHDGYNGIMLGMPDASVHLEFTQHIHGSPCPAPTKDNLLVLYFNTSTDRDLYVDRLTQMDYPIVEPENSYWLANGITIADPDGWRVVLVNKPGFSVE
ncbi:MAG: VOC family protein [Bacteroidota bacterium]